MSGNKGSTALDYRHTLIRKASLIALFGNLALSIAKLSVGFISGSLSVISDGIDTSTDVLIACMVLIIGKIVTRPSDKNHPWGHGRAETMGTLVLSFIILFVSFEIARSAIEHLINQTSPSRAGIPALIITGISIIVKLLLAFSQIVLGNKANSSIVKANAQNMINDIVISSSVFFGLMLSYVFNAPIIDPIVALIVSIWIIINALKIFWEMNIELMDGNHNKLIYQQLFDAVRAVKGASNPHRVRMRKIATFWDVDLDIEVDANLSVKEAHDISEKVSEEIKKRIPDIYDIMVHIEPEGHEESHWVEGFGLREEDVQQK